MGRVTHMPAAESLPLDMRSVKLRKISAEGGDVRFWRSLSVRSIALTAAAVLWTLLLTANASAQSTAGPAPIVAATDTGASPESFRPSTHGPAAAPNHPPLDQVPPMPMPFNPDQERGSSGRSSARCRA